MNQVRTLAIKAILAKKRLSLEKGGLANQPFILRIDDALRRIDEGKPFGICGECEDEISLTRIEALIFVGTCAQCAPPPEVKVVGRRIHGKKHDVPFRDFLR
jgi:hypothetical protein